MFQQLNSTYKGLITGLLMIAMSLIFFYTGVPVESPWQYSIYLLYAGGITWSIYSFSGSADKNNTFANCFLQGFKCFVVITLLMVVFTYLFNKMHPEFADKMLSAYRTDLVKEGNKTPAEIDAELTKMKNYYLPMMVSTAVFGFLLVGAAITGVASFLFMNRKQQ